MNDAVQVLVLAAGEKPWALGAFVFLLGLGGLAFLAVVGRGNSIITAQQRECEFVFFLGGPPW